MALANKNQASARSVVPAMPEELSLYLKGPLTDLEANPIKYWTDMAKAFPDLSKIALKYLSVVATSVTCERLFSKAENIMTEKRNRLKGQKLHMQIFLNEVDRSLW